MKTILPILLLISNFLFAQTIVVCDSITKQPIAFASVLMDDKGAFTDMNGRFAFDKKVKNIKISHISYVDRVLAYRANVDSIFLTPKPIQLEMVTITNVSDDTKKMGFLKRYKKMRSIPLKPKREIVINVIPKPSDKSYKIQEVCIPLQKIKHYNKTDTLYKNQKAYFRMNVYRSNGDVLNKVYQSPYMDYIMSKKESLTLDVSKENLYLDRAGVFVGIEMIGKIDADGSIVEDDTYIRPLITAETSEDYNASTYLKSSFDNAINAMVNINKFNEHLISDIKRFKEKPLNLAIGLVVLEE